MSVQVERRPRSGDQPGRDRGRQSTGTRRFGYSVAITVNLVLLYLINRSPGWQAVPFLTSGMAEVVPLVNASLIAGSVANLVYAVVDPRWLRALGETVTTSIGVAAMVRMWNVWPFDFDTTSVDWDLVSRVVLGFAIVGAVIGVIVAVVTLARALHRP